MAMPLHRSLMTLDEYLALPEDESARCELQEGVLVVSPRPLPLHQEAILTLGMQIHTQLPAGLRVLPEVDVVVKAETPATVRAPDLVITTASRQKRLLAAADIVLAMEIISPGSRNVDLHLKAFEYADAGIPHYWVVDIDPPAPSITVFGLGAPGDGYVESQLGVTGELVVTEPSRCVSTSPHSPIRTSSPASRTSP